jgi:hypothetical protein
MTIFKKIKCKLGYHDDELLPVLVSPVLYSRYPEFNEVVLRPYNSHMWKCKNCGKEKVIYR